MDRRALADIFRHRLAQVLADPDLVRADFIRQSDIDRSALSQFLAPDQTRLPRAETLRNMAQASGVTVDWLLGLENAPEGRQDVAASVQIEQSQFSDGTTPLERWHEEARGSKLRYVPSSLPDMLRLDPTGPLPQATAQTGGREAVLDGVVLDDLDIEIAMPIQTLRDLAGRTGLWRGMDLARCQQQLRHMARICQDAYPRIRLYLYDGASNFSAPFTVFGNHRAALYIGGAYLVTTAPEQVRGFSRRFDALVRISEHDSASVHQFLNDLAG